MTRAEVLDELKALGDEKTRAIAHKHGAGEDNYGVKMGDLRNVAKRIKTDHALALELWETGNDDARLLATLIIKPKELSVAELDSMVRSVSYPQLADWLTSYVIKQHPRKEELREKWMSDSDPGAARAGWSLTTERVVKSAEGLDMGGLLDRIDKEMASAPEFSKWTMNFCLLEIGVNHPDHRDRAIAIGEKIGAYRDYPCAKGCITPFAPIAIAELVKRKG